MMPVGQGSTFASIHDSQPSPFGEISEWATFSSMAGPSLVHSDYGSYSDGE